VREKESVSSRGREKREKREFILPADFQEPNPTFTSTVLSSSQQTALKG